MRGKVVVITGASGGIGRETAAAFSRLGARLVLAGRDRRALEEVRDGLMDPGAAISVETDVNSLRSVHDLAAAAIDRFGQIDVWVNNAVVAMYGDFERVPLEHFRQVFETAFFGYVHGADAVLPVFRKQRRGTLINVASVLGVLAIPHMSAYVSAKHAVVAFSECLRQELAGSGIHVCMVLPATMDTPFYSHAANFTGRKIEPLPPVHRPELVAKAVVELAQSPRKQRFVPRSAAVLPIMRAVFPQLTESISRELIDRFQIGEERAPETEGNLYRPLHERSSASTRKTIWFAAAGLVAASGLLFAARRTPLRKAA